MEPAVLVLREVLDYEYSEIASFLGQSEPSCRQILRRARQHIKESRPRFDASMEQRAQLLRGFSEASSQGHLEGLVALLSPEAVFHSDGGGKAPALPKPIYGPENIARGILEGLSQTGPKKPDQAICRAQRTAGIVTYLDATPFIPCVRPRCLRRADLSYLRSHQPGETQTRTAAHVLTCLEVRSDFSLKKCHEFRRSSVLELAANNCGDRQ